MNPQKVFLFLLTLLCFADNSIPRQLRESRFITINGIEQWITIHGNSEKPVLLLVHGGPGSVMSPFSRNMYQTWESEFIIVTWDQRGAGRTFGKVAPVELTPDYFNANPLTVDQIVADGIAITEYLTKHLSKQKVIVFGTSWGSIVAGKMAAQRGELYHAYIGHSQVVKGNDLFGGYNRVMDLAKAANDTESIAKLTTLGAPPYASARDFGGFLRVLKKYERAAETPAPNSFFQMDPEYANSKDDLDRENGDDYSFANFAGDQKLGLTSMASTVDFKRDHLWFSTPVYLMQGKHDLLTPEIATREYFAALTAPTKEYYLMTSAAHGFNEEVIATQLAICRKVADTIKE